jgi:tetratricopeptide (TPR) repeat protein
MFLGLDAESDLKVVRDEPPPERFAAFSEFLRHFIQQTPVVSETELVNLMEELTQMRMGAHTLWLHERNQIYDLSNNFRGLLALGSAAMLENELAIAEGALKRAQSVVPDEVAPYVNLAQIFFSQQRDGEALKWALAGLDADPNNFRLWESIALVFQAENADEAGGRLRALAEQRGSWAGLSLSALLIDPDDKLLRAQLLEGLYDSGLRDVGFLVEYTAALGAAGQYDRIPAIVWSAQMELGDDLGWRLFAHGAQAHIAQDQYSRAQQLLDRALIDPQLPDSARNQLNALRDECISSNANPAG